MHRGLIFMVLLVMVSALEAAEPPAGSTEITVHSGWSFLDVDYSFNPCPECLGPYDPTITTTVRNSMTFGFKGGYYLNRTMEIEGAFSVAAGHRVEQRGTIVCIPELPCPAGPMFPPSPGYPVLPPYFGDSKAIAYQYDGNFAYNFPTGAASPFLTFGVGGISTAVGGDSHHDFAFNYGGGAKFYFGNVGVRLEVNDHVIPDYFLTGKTEHDFQVQYGFVFRLNGEKP